MLKLKEFYQQKRDLLKTNKSLKLKLRKRVKKVYKLFLPLKERQLEKKQLKKIAGKKKLVKKKWGRKKWNKKSAKSERKNLAILYVSSSLNNTFVTLTNLKGKARHVRSAGLCGFQTKKKRSTKFAVKAILNSVAKFARDQRVRKVFLCLKGFAKFRRYVAKSLKNKNIQVVGIRDITPNPHNGCRPRKKRRV
jgi:small subunit ribosomal protein S11